MPTDNNVLRPLQRTHHTVRGRAITMQPMDESSRPTPKASALPTLKAGSLTQTFFARGEEQEATGYQNLAIDDPVLAPPELEFDSFDKIPRKRTSWFALGISLLVLAAVGLVTWRSFHFLSRPGSSVAAASRAMVQEPPAQTTPAPAGPMMSVAPPVPAAPIISSAPSAAPTPAPSAPEAEENAAPPPQPAPAAPAPHAVAPVIVPLPPRHESARTKHQPLRGYVWSPEKHTIVPAEPAVDDPLPAEAPRTQTLEGTPAEEPPPPRERTSPAPFEATPAPAPSPVPNTSAPIIE